LTPLSYGESCPDSLEIAPVLSIQKLNFSSVTILDGSSIFSFTVYVANKRGYSSSANVIIEVKDKPLPTVSIGAVALKYNRESKITLTGLVFASSRFTASWDCSTLPGPINQLNLTATAYPSVAGNGKTTFLQFAIKPDVLVAGLSYTFVLRARYLTAGDTNSEAYSTVTVSINAPPSDGMLTVQPSTGVALNTTFFFQTSGWMDDVSDYPINFVMMYYTISEAVDATIVKKSSPISFSSSLVGQGLESSGYNVTCAVSASDIYGGSGDNAFAIIAVGPQVLGAQLADEMQNLLGDAFALGNFDAISQVVGVLMKALNAVDCSDAPDSLCTSYNRYMLIHFVLFCSFFSMFRD
jgi:hypothetical protein